jgi:hypothetical protein
MYIRTFEGLGLGEPQPICEAAEHNLERLSTSLKMFNRESGKTYGDPKRLKNLGSLVVGDAEAISERLASYIERGCCEPELKILEAQVRALPWIFQRTRGTKVVRVEVFRDIVRAHSNVIKAIQQAQRTASSHTMCTSTSSPSGPGAQPSGRE